MLLPPRAGVVAPAHLPSSTPDPTPLPAQHQHCNVPLPPHAGVRTEAMAHARTVPLPNPTSTPLRSSLPLSPHQPFHHPRPHQPFPVQEARLQASLDALYDGVFKGISVQVPVQPDPAAADDEPAAAATADTEPAMETYTVSSPLTEAGFQELSRSRAAAAAAVMAAAEAADGAAWRSFQSSARTLAMQRSRVAKEADEVAAAVLAAERAAARSGVLGGTRLAVPIAPADSAAAAAAAGGGGGARRAAGREARIVLISGFESFNVGLYKDAAKALKRQMPHVTLQVRGGCARVRGFRVVLARVGVVLGYRHMQRDGLGLPGCAGPQGGKGLCLGRGCRMWRRAGVGGRLGGVGTCGMLQEHGRARGLMVPEREGEGEGGPSVGPQCVTRDLV